MDFWLVECNKRMLLESSGRAVIISISILILGGLLLREYGWYRWTANLKKQPQVNLDFSLSKPVDETISYCIIDYHGLEIRVSRATCLKTGLVTSQAGDQIAVIGSWKQVVIRSSKHQKSFIQASKLTIKSQTPQAVVSLHWWQRMMTSLHRQVVAIYQQSLPEPEASLVAGVVVGEQRALPVPFQEALVVTGLMHVVAASGYNVVVVISAISTIAVRWLGRRWGSVCALIGIGLYVLLAGASPPVIRAGLMGSLTLVAVLSGRLYWAWWSFFITLMSMLLVSPWLIQSISFQLTVAATAGLMRLRTSLDYVWPQTTGRQLAAVCLQSVRDSFLTTVAAVIATLPLQVIYFGNVSLLGLVVNPLVSWLIPPLMTLGSLHAVMGIIWSSLADTVAWVSYTIAHTFVTLVIWTSRSSFGYYSVAGNWWSAVGWWLLWLGVARGIEVRHSDGK